MHLKDLNFPQALEHICYYCGIPYDGIIQPKKEDNLSWLHNIKKKRKQNKDISTNNVLPEHILNQFIPLPHQMFLDDGISIETQKEFGIRYDLAHDRIIIPLRNKQGELIGVKGRHIEDTDDIIKYYIYWQEKYPIRTDLEFYNLHRALPSIIETKKCYIFEAEKSPMVLFPEYKNCISLGCSSISYAQRKILQDLILNYQVEIIFALDQGLDLEQVFQQHEIQMLKKYTTLYYIETDTLGEKESPADRGVQFFEELLKEKLTKIQ